MKISFLSCKKKKNKRGNSTLEYMVMFVAGIGVLFIFLRPNGPLQRVFHRTLSSGSYMMEQQMARQEVSRGQSSSTSNSSVLGVSFSVWYGDQGGYSGSSGSGPSGGAGSTGDGGGWEQ